MTQVEDESRDPQALHRRLEDLESELLRLRRELASADNERSCPLEPPFQILRAYIGDDLYGLPIRSVVEIVRYVRLTQIADVPRGIVGAVNLRGSVHAVLDGRIRFGLA